MSSPRTVLINNGGYLYKNNLRALVKRGWMLLREAKTVIDITCLPGSKVKSALSNPENLTLRYIRINIYLEQ